MTIKKDIGVIIKFDDKEYSKEEMIFLYQRLFNFITEESNIKNIPQFLGKAVVESIFEKQKRAKEIRTFEIK